MYDPRVSEAELCALLLRVFWERVLAFDLGQRVHDVLRGSPEARVLAVGKSAARMLAGAQRVARDVLLVLPEGAEISWASPRTRVMFADHPAPTERSVAAAEAALAFVAEGGDVLALVSGGTSALLSAPLHELGLPGKRALHAALLRAGVPIADINVVRRHASRIKGGALGVAAAGRVRTLIASDVLSGGAYDVGSGPTVPDPTTVADAERVLARCALSAPLVETVKPEDPRAARLEHQVVATPADLAAAIVAGLEAAGLTVFLLPPSEAPVEELARAYAGFAGTLNPGQALVRAAEPAVAMGAAGGRGGRSTHLAALAGRSLPAGVALLCGASDGVDGASLGAGAVVTRAVLADHDVDAAVLRFDTGALLEAAGALIATRGPTGLNLCDVHVVARAPA